MQMILKTVECYRLWPDNRWDKVEITVEIPEQMTSNDEFIESRAVQKAWLSLIGEEKKPYQIGLYMLSLHGVK